jgi:hypothetical protein
MFQDLVSQGRIVQGRIMQSRNMQGRIVWGRIVQGQIVPVPRKLEKNLFLEKIEFNVKVHLFWFPFAVHI